MVYRYPYPNELYHHGILGMKWGVRNGPPYPLGVGEHSRSEETAGWKKSLNKNDNSFSKSGNTSEDLNHFDETKQRKIMARNGNAVLAVDVHDNKSSDKSFWSQHKKEILIGAAAVAVITVGAVVVTKQLKNRSVANASLDSQELEYLVNRAKLGLTGEGKAEYGGFANGQEQYIAAWLNADSKRMQPLTESDYLSMGNDTTLLRAGESMFRMSKNVHSSLRDVEYVSFGDDRERYLGFLPRVWKANANALGQPFKKVYNELELTANNTIKAPGMKETFEIYEAVLDKDGIYGHGQKAHEAALKTFNLFYANMASMGRGGGTTYDKFFDEARGRGYNAVVDFNDAGRLADKPLILLGANTDASIKNSINVHFSTECKKAFDDIKLPSDLSGFTLEKFMNTSYRDAYMKFFKMML